MGDDSDWKNLSTLDKIEHKNWKARVEGYEAALKELQKADDGKDAVFNPYLNLAKKMVIDSNAAAQEKAMDVVEIFVQVSNVAPKCAAEVCPGIVNKCLNATRPKTKEKGIEILKLFIEAEKHDVVIDELIKGLSLKAPKVIIGCIIALKESLNEFGPKVVPVKELFKQIPKLLEDRDKGVRESGKELIVEIYRWVGRQAMEPMLSQLKPVQVTEVSQEFEKLEGGKPVPTRYLKSQKPKVIPKPVSNGPESSGDQPKGPVVEQQAAIDPYEFIDPVEVIKNIPANFFQKIEEKKWTDRKEALEEIDKITNFPKLIPGDYSDLVKSLNKVISKDTNVVLVALSAKIVAQIAIGIRKKFSPYALETLKTCFEKFKERKANVVKALRDCVDASYASISLDVCLEDVQAALAHKTPAVRSETVQFINRIFERSTPDSLAKKHLKVLATLLGKTCLDSVPEVRDSCFQALGTATYVVGEKILKPYLEGVDAVKLARIQDSYEKYKEEKSGKTVAEKVETAVPVSAPNQPAVSVSKPPKSAEQKPKQVASEADKKQKPKPITGGAKKPSGKETSQGKVVPTEPPISEDDAMVKMEDLMGEKFMEKLTDKNYKERLSAMEQIQEFVNKQDPDKLPCQLITRALTIKPGFKDNNIMVLKLKMEVMKTVVTKGKLTWTAVEFCIPDLTEKIGDIKNSVIIKSTLTEMSDILDLTMVAEQVIKTVSENVNIKNIIETLNWIGECLLEFGFKIPLDKMLPFIKSTLSHTSPVVRQASIKLVGIISLFVRDVIGKMLESEKASVKQLIDQEIENMKNTSAPLPTRGCKAGEGSGQDVEDGANESDTRRGSGSGGVGGGSKASEIDTDSLIPRDNISHLLSETLLEKFNDKSWKVKKEAFESITNILSGHAGIAGEGLGQLLTALSKCTSDSSAIIKKMALESLSNIAKLLSKKDCEKFARTVIPGLLSACADAKPKNREEAVSVLSLWNDKIGFGNCCDGNMLTDALKIDNPYQRAAIITWITPHLKQFGENKELKKSLNPDFGTEILAPFFGCLEDRNPDVRKAAQEALVPLMMVLGFDQMMKFHNANTKLASRENIKNFLEKAKEQLPKPVPTAAKQSTQQAKQPQKDQDGNKENKEKKQTANGEGKPTKESKNARKSVAVKGKGKNTANAAPPPAVETPAQPFVSTLNKASNKRQRIMDDKKKKITQWDPNPMNIQQLESQFQGNCNPDLLSLLFSKDFKNFIKAIDMLSNFLSENNEESIEATQQNLDIILKWAVIRFSETNPSVIFKCLDYLNKVFNILGSNTNFQLHDQEAMSFLPGLCSKLGDPKDQVRNNARILLVSILSCYPENKVCQFLEDQLESKVAKARQECTDFLRFMIDERKLEVYSHKPLLKTISQLISERDNSVRTAALNCLVSAHNFMGEDLMTLLKSLNQKERDMLEERIKRTGKPVSGSENPTTAENTNSSISNSRASSVQPDKKGKRDSIAPRDSSVGTRSNNAQNSIMTNPVPAPIDINPLLKEDIAHKLIDLEQDIAEINQPVEELQLRYTGRSNQTLNANDAIRAVISDINDSEMSKSIHAMAQIDEVIRNDDVSSQLKCHMEKLMQSITMKMSVTVGKFSEESYNESEISDVFRVILATLMSIFSVKELALEIPRSCLIELMDRLLNTVISEQLISMADGSGIVRGINLLSVRILDASEQTTMLSCLLRLMTECLKKGDNNSKYLHLLYKCIWSMTKNLVNTIKTINLLVIMKDINVFFSHFPPSKFEGSNIDVAIRTVKTLIHSIIQNNKGGILEIIHQIPNGPNKELDGYVRKSYTKLKIPIPAVLPTPPDAKAGSGDSEFEMNGKETETAGYLKQSYPFTSNRLNKSANVHSDTRPYIDELKQIFNKIGKPEESEQGLNDLYDFKIKYPYVDLNRYLKQTSAYFQKTIETGLRDISEKRNASQMNNQSNNNGAVSSLNNDGWVNCEMNPDNIMKRLHAMRQKVGLDNQSESLSDRTTKINRTLTARNTTNNQPDSSSTQSNDEMDTSFISSLNASGDGPTSASKPSFQKNIRRMSSDEVAAYRQRMAHLGKLDN